MNWLRNMFIPLLLSNICITSMTSCSTTGEEIKEDITMRVNSSRVDCTGVGPQSCLQVMEIGKDSTWQWFYSEIQGFLYEPGFLYTIRVGVRKLPADQVPADGSSLSYTLIRIIEKSPDARLVLHDIWALKNIIGDEYEIPLGTQRPWLEINIPRETFAGFDGCAEMDGSIDLAGDAGLRFLSNSSKPSGCENLLAANFQALLSRVDGYRREGLELILMEQDQELLVLQKVD